jgi:large subunit ribosomal protein L4
MEVEIFDQKRNSVGKIDLNPAVFEQKISTGFLHEVHLAYLAGRRAGTACTKTRGDVSGTGKKPFRQKGTGRARQGTTRAPHMPGGGIAFGPKPRSYDMKVSKKAKRTALKQALSWKAQTQEIMVVDKLEISKSKTKIVAGFLKQLQLTGKVLIVGANPTQELIMASRNIPNVIVTSVAGLNAESVLATGTVLFTPDALEQIEERFKS